MPRIPYRLPQPGEDEIADQYIERRGGKLLPLDGVLLHSNDIGEGWNLFMGGLRERNTVRGDIRELMILRVAVLNSAKFEWDQHEPYGRQEGLTDTHLRAVLCPNLSGSSLSSPSPFTYLQLAVLNYTDAMTKNIKVPTPVFEHVRFALEEELASENKPSLLDRQIVEITTTIASYNMVSTILVALDVDDKADAPVCMV